MTLPRLGLCLVGGAVIFLAGLATGWKIYRPVAAVVETYAPEKLQSDRSLILERKPMPEAEARKTLPVPAIPKGAQLERVSRVELLPRIPDSGEGLKTIPSSPLRVDLTLIRENDGRRVVASSPDGDIVGGLDIPIVEPSTMARPLYWSAGGSWNPVDRTYGVWAHRDIGPLVAGVHAFQQRMPSGDLKAAGMVTLGIRF